MMPGSGVTAYRRRRDREVKASERDKDRRRDDRSDGKVADSVYGYPATAAWPPRDVERQPAVVSSGSHEDDANVILGPNLSAQFVGERGRGLAVAPPAPMR
jgi:hypothetical protein